MFSIVVFTYNSEKIIEKTLNSIFEAAKVATLDSEVIVIDNNSSDRTLELISAHKKSHEINIIVNHKQGLAYSRRKAALSCNGDYVVFVDDDNIISKNYICVLEKIIKNYNATVIGGCSIYEGNIKLPTWWEKYREYYACGCRFQNSRFLNGKFDKMWGAGLCIESTILKKALGGFDLFCIGRCGNKQLSGEDTELNYRLKLLGGKFYFSTELLLYHHIADNRINKNKLNQMMHGNAQGAIIIDIYRYLIGGILYHPILQILYLIILSPYYTIKFRINYIKYVVLRISNYKTNIQRLKQLKTYLNNVR